MALQVWLPLNGNLNNQGLSNITVTNSGATVDNNGKIGKCYSFNGSTSHVSIDSSEIPNILNGSFSICMWIYNNDNGGRSILCGQYSIQTSGGFNIEKSTGNYVRFYWNGTVDFYTTNLTLTPSVWSHLVITRDGDTVKFYLDGVLKDTSTSSLSRYSIPSANTVLRIGRDYRSDTTSFNGKLNDFRIYDHALAPKEIEILSRGLVCHYPLCNNGNGQANLLKNSNFTEGSSGSQGYNFSATWAKQTDCIKITSTSAAAGLYTANYDSVTTGDMATFSAYVKADASMTIYIGVDGGGLVNCDSFTVGTSWQRISISKAKTTNNANLRVYGNGTFYVRHMKYELGSTVTPWCPNSADSVYSSMGYDSTTEYDVSGYGYNGTKSKAMLYTSNTARYSVAIIFDGNTDSIKIPFNQMLGLTSTAKTDYTVSVWTYKSVIGTKNYQTILGGPGGFELEARDVSSTDPKYRIHNWGSATTPYELNKWNHFCFVHTATDSKLYVNGELKITGSSANVPIGDFFIGAWSVYNSQNYEGQMSDFRIYATALSATQVAELYNTAVSVANNGTLMGYELVEV